MDRVHHLRVQPVLLCDRIRENPQYSFSQCEQLDPPTAGRQWQELVMGSQDVCNEPVA